MEANVFVLLAIMYSSHNIISPHPPLVANNKLSKKIFFLHSDFYIKLI